MTTNSEGASQGYSGVLTSPEVPRAQAFSAAVYSWGTAAISRSAAVSYASLSVPWYRGKKGGRVHQEEKVSTHGNISDVIFPAVRETD